MSAPMSVSDTSLSPVSSPPESGPKDSLQVLPALTRLVYRWCVGLINRTLERFPALQHGISRLEAAEMTIRRLRQERDEALGFLRERNQELAHYDTAVRNLFSVVSEVTREMEDIRQALLTYNRHVAEHLSHRESNVLQLQYRLQEAAMDMQEAQADLDDIEETVRHYFHQREGDILQLQYRLQEAAVDMEEVQADLNDLELAVRRHLQQLGRRIEVADLALFGMLEVAKETEGELDLLSQQVHRQHRLFARVYGESLAENARLTQEIDTLVAEAAQTNEMTAKHIRALEQELASLRSR
ncbi:hypothetical protein [Chloracidobacterium aggregatum]|uniref:Chromosome partition protein Smc n=1 Tax=Chloracidobacterium sp. N TaxID=2821540 RepID=A0ABX8B6Q1_9BACT|nr:hypothetical protein [Chloracidobacterium aggregatum]QUV84938.1 hypothetical protein J8C03_01240 [Chloracidobacterium sp. 2]QUV88658.1 hypothetical protein J8C07_04895 [Chloracidobacterium sp. S]QUV91580.1 hypothetical protein J8C04_04045 [Chloracidobacterium sp. A]QUV94756.1 hypothetical protein J8C05_04735 [Chloracidobacterium sp. N]QUV95864.1 hypothetical protein J8C00_05825 [Chloracidobacterium sp. E]